MDYRELEDEVSSALADPVPVRLEHPGLVRQRLAQDAEQGLELVPVHGVADEHQPLAAQPRQEVRRVEPTDLARQSANDLGIVFARVRRRWKRRCWVWVVGYLGRLQWRGAQRHRVYPSSGRPFAAQE
jgi:hypothetical protein